jgi:uncharacterized membrane protein
MDSTGPSPIGSRLVGLRGAVESAWISLLRIGQLRESLRTSLWFVPTICVIVAVVVSQVLVRVEPRSTSTWLFGGGAESARTLLSTLAASMITFLGLTFSITMVVLQLTSSQYSPRVLRTFLRDRQSQWTLGIFVATFVYVVLVLREVRGGAGLDAEFVPGPAITFAFVLLLASLGAFVAYINHMAQSIRPESIIAAVGAETAALIAGRPDLDAGDTVDTPPGPDPTEAPKHLVTTTIVSTNDGMVQSIHVDHLLGIAARDDLHLLVRPRIGDFVPSGSVLIDVVSEPGRPTSSPLDDELADSLRVGIGIGRDRTMQQDIAFGVRQLVDIGVRALSPGVNDPTTAVQVLDGLHGLLRAFGSKALPTSAHLDQDGTVRVELAAARWDDYVHLAFDELRHYGGDSMQVLRRLHAALDDLAVAVPPHRRGPLLDQIELVRAAAGRSFPDLVDRENAARPDAQGIGSGQLDPIVTRP